MASGVEGAATAGDGLCQAHAARERQLTHGATDEEVAAPPADDPLDDVPASIRELIDGCSTLRCLKTCIAAKEDQRTGEVSPWEPRFGIG